MPRKKLVTNDQRISLSNIDLHGDKNTYRGDKSYIKGNRNTIYMNNGTIVGNGNDLHGDGNNVEGDNNRLIKGKGNKFKGTNNKYNATDNPQIEETQVVAPPVERPANSLDNAIQAIFRSNRPQRTERLIITLHQGPEERDPEPEAKKRKIEELKPGIEVPKEEPLKPDLTDEQVDEGKGCRICFYQPIEAVNVPCGHMCLCIRCSRTYEKKDVVQCIICKSHLTQIMKYFPPEFNK